MIQAAFTDAKRLICLMKQVDQSGSMLVAVELKQNHLLVQCPSAHKHRDAVKEAAACFKCWKWWQKDQPIKVESAQLLMKPEWRQITVPGSIEHMIQQAGEEEAHAAEYFGYCR